MTTTLPARRSSIVGRMLRHRRRSGWTTLSNTLCQVGSSISAADLPRFAGPTQFAIRTSDVPGFACGRIPKVPNIRDPFGAMVTKLWDHGGPFDARLRVRSRNQPILPTPRLKPRGATLWILRRRWGFHGDLQCGPQSRWNQREICGPQPGKKDEPFEPRHPTRTCSCDPRRRTRHAHEIASRQGSARALWSIHARTRRDGC